MAAICYRFWPLVFLSYPIRPRYRGIGISYFRALKLGRAAQVAPFDKLSVVLMAIFATTFLGEHLLRVHWLGVLLDASGAILLAIQV